MRNLINVAIVVGVFVALLLADAIFNGSSLSNIPESLEILKEAINK